MEIGVHIIVKGIVQGVGFRYYVYNYATKLGLHGFVQNLFDGSVEIEAYGERSLLEELIKAVKIGPRSAHVTEVNVKWIEYKTDYKYFEII
mgnify:FL=1